MDRSTILTSIVKQQKKKELDSEKNNTISNEWYNQAKFHDATTLVSRYTKLTEFSAHTLYPKLTTLDLEGNKISSIDLSNNKNLNFLNLQSSQLTSINLSHLANLTVIWLFDNKIRKINLTSNEHLAFINLQSNGLE